MSGTTQARIALYILRRDTRLSDNPVFHFAAQQFKRRRLSRSPSFDSVIRDDSLTSDHAPSSFTHLLPIYVFPAHQIESSGFLSSPADRNPYPEARSQVARVWRTGPHRAKFIGEGVWDLKQRIEDLGCGSGLEMRVGMIEDVVRHVLESYSDTDGPEESKPRITEIWITDDEGTEEQKDQQLLEKLAARHGAKFRVWTDEKFYVDDRDLPYKSISDLPNVYTTYRKSLEPLRNRPRESLPTPTELPPLPPDIPPQKEPFKIPTSLSALIEALLSPLLKESTYALPKPPEMPKGVQSAHPFEGGEGEGLARIAHLVSTGAMSTYKATRNGMLGLDFSTKLSAYLAQGHITARQVHRAMLDFEEGRGPGNGVQGYGQGENEGTAAVRFELLWRDYFRLCMRKFGHKMFALYGIQPHGNAKSKSEEPAKKRRWRTLNKSTGPGDDPRKTLEIFTRFRSGRTGVGLIDASNRELYLTGYTSNRARQNVASFLSSHLELDWRIGAEWYESLLVDYDVSSNWGNWQYVAGVGNDPRQGRVFNPVKQALDYDPQGEYIKAWVPELRKLRITQTAGSGKEEIDSQRLLLLYQSWKLSDREKGELGLNGIDWVERPLTRIHFSVGPRGPADGRMKRGRGGGGVGPQPPGGAGRGHWRGGRGGRGSRDFRMRGNEKPPVHKFEKPPPKQGEDGPTIVSG